MAGLTIAALAAVAVAVLALVPAGSALSITSPGPLTTIEVGASSQPLSCRVNINGSPTSEFFGGNACGTYLYVGGTKYWPGAVPAGGSACAGSCTVWTVSTQTGPTGLGTVANPYKVAFTGTAGAISWSETDQYVTGNWYYTTYFNITNTGSTPLTGTLWRAGDCYLAASDSGYGWVDPVNVGGIACTQSASASSGALIEWIPHTPGSTYDEDQYGTVWSVIGSNTAFPNSCTCAVNQDNGAGISWTFTIMAGQTLSYNHDTLFSDNGIVQPPPPPPPPPPPTCAPASISLGTLTNQLFSATSGTGTYAWAAPGGTPASGSGSGFTTQYGAAGSYTVTVTSGSLTATCAVTIWAPNAPPSGLMTGSTPGSCTDSSWTFTAYSLADSGPDGSGGTTGQVTNLRWTFGDGTPVVQGNPISNPALLTVTHQYTTVGTFTATLRITDNAGLFIDVPFLVNSIGDPDCCPTMEGYGPLVAYEGDLIQFIAIASDPEGQPITYTATGLPLGATFSIGGAFMWMTQEGDRGDYLVTVSATDAAGCVVSFQQRIRVLVIPSQVPDRDQDGIADEQDNCPNAFNADQTDADGNGEGDACGIYATGQRRDTGGQGSNSAPGSTGSTLGGTAIDPITDGVADTDRDGLADNQDNCIDIANPLQLDVDHDNRGDACDDDADGDFVPDTRDECVAAPESPLATSGCAETGALAAAAGAEGSACATCAGAVEGGRSAQTQDRESSSIPVVGLAVSAGLAVVGAVAAAFAVRRWR